MIIQEYSIVSIVELVGAEKYHYVYTLDKSTENILLVHDYSEPENDWLQENWYEGEKLCQLHHLNYQNFLKIEEQLY